MRITSGPHRPSLWTRAVPSTSASVRSTTISVAPSIVSFAEQHTVTSENLNKTINLKKIVLFFDYNEKKYKLYIKYIDYVTTNNNNKKFSFSFSFSYHSFVFYLFPLVVCV